VLLVRADDPGRAALDPAGAVDTRRYPSALVRDRAARSVEAHARQLDAAVADAAEDEATSQRLVLVRGHGAVVRVELIADELDPLDPLLAENRNRRLEEAEDDPARLAPGRTCCEVPQNGEVAHGIRALRLRALEVGRIHDDVGAREFAHLLQLGSGERGLGRAPPPHD